MGCVKLLCFIFHNIILPRRAARPGRATPHTRHSLQLHSKPTLADFTPKVVLFSSTELSNQSAVLSALRARAVHRRALQKCKTYYYA